MSKTQSNILEQVYSQIDDHLRDEVEIKELSRKSLRWVIGGIVANLLGFIGLKVLTVSLGDFMVFCTLIVAGVGALYIGGTRYIETIMEANVILRLSNTENKIVKADVKNRNRDSTNPLPSFTFPDLPLPAFINPILTRQVLNEQLQVVEALRASDKTRTSPFFIETMSDIANKINFIANKSHLVNANLMIAMNETKAVDLNAFCIEIAEPNKVFSVTIVYGALGEFWQTRLDEPETFELVLKQTSKYEDLENRPEYQSANLNNLLMG